MAVIHISEAEAARDLSAVLARVRAGEMVVIGEGASTVAMVKHTAIQPPRKTLTAALRWAEEQDLQILLDDQFGHDMEKMYENHRSEVSRNPWGD